MVIDKKIVFKNNKAYKATKLSAILKADSLVYGLFDQDNVLHEVACFEDISDVNLVDYIANDFIGMSLGTRLLAYGDKPFLHSAISGDDVIKVIPSFDGKVIHEDVMTGYDAYTIHGMASRWNPMISKLALKDKPVHVSTLDAHYLYPNHHEAVLAHISKDTIRITHVNPDHFVFHNIYYCLKAEDYLYWIMAVYNALKLDKKHHSLILAGDIDLSSEIYKLIYDYIQNVEFATVTGELSASEKGEKHYFFDLFNLVSCES